jgi:divalent metal cation (Fe/Co/Zn/Cd) transporter
VRHRLQAELPNIQDVVVHVEPTDGSRPDVSLLVPTLRGLVDDVDMSIHDISAREVEGQYSVEVHLVVDGQMPLGRAHELASAFEQQAHDEIPSLIEIITHIEPASQRQEEGNRSAIQSRDVVAEASELVQARYGPDMCHDLRAYPLDGNWGITLHCCVDEDMTLERAHEISSQIETCLRDSIPRLSRVTVHTEPRSAA